MTPSASIIINTYNRAGSLERTLQSLRFLDYPNFEVIVVNGPSTDETAEVLSRWEKDLKLGSCPEPNLSVSRNIGIAMAAGEIVAFIDDDAIPEPEWLARLVEGYDEKEIGGVGGCTFDHTGSRFQAKYTICNRFGRARLENDVNPTASFNFPQAFEYCAHLGTNSSFRRDTLVKIGGFDEEYEYFLDETDVCVRMIDRGFVIRFSDDAFVHHKFLPSHIRNEHRVLNNWYPIIKNTAYFAAKNASLTHSFEQITENVFSFVDELRQSVRWAIEQKLLASSDLESFETAADEAAKDGFSRGLNQPRKLISQAILARHAQAFKRFPVILDDEKRLTLCFLSWDFPPGCYGGISRFTDILSHGIARRGHNVHVITKGEGHDRVDLEDGVWVHRVVIKEFNPADIPEDYPVCRMIHNYSRTMLEEVRRIDAHHRIDVVEAPIWNSEGLQLVLDDAFKERTVISLETPMKIVSENNKSWIDSPDIQRAIKTEEFVLKNGRSFHAISRAILETISEKYDNDFQEAHVGLVPLGIPDKRDLFQSAAKATDGLTVLFVGRLEPRKGIDVLLDIIPELLREHPRLRFIIAGDDSLLIDQDDSESTYRNEFTRKYSGEPFLEQVRFTGRLSDEELNQQYAGCDIFVAPSRYESFGLIFLEAMMFGKPVVGCRAGGMVEVIEENGNGLLADPGDRDSLLQSLKRLIEDPALRARFGARSRQLYEERFTDETMVDNALKFYLEVMRADSSRCADRVIR